MRLTRLTSAAAVTLTCLTLANPALAQRRQVPPEPVAQPQATGPVAIGTGASAEETRRDLEEVLKQYPPTLGRVLRLDPTLLSNPGYLQPYPALQAFLSQHPEVAHNSGYFFAGYDSNWGDSRSRLTAQE